MLVIPKEDLARNLIAYGEEAVSAQLSSMSPEDYRRVCEIGFRHALSGMMLLKAGCLAAIEVVEGRPRELKRKRRDWTSVPPAAYEPDPRFVAIRKRFEQYGAGTRLRKPEVLSGVFDRLRDRLPDFRYFRSHHHFRRPFAGGTSFIGLDYAHGSLALRFGVRHEGIEATRVRLFEPKWTPPKLSPTTISKFSINMGPSSPHWTYPTETTWPISGSEGLERASPEIAAFIDEVVLPYVTAHQDPATIRDTLLNHPGHADQWVWDGVLVFSLDCFLRRRDWLDADHERLRAHRQVQQAAPAALDYTGLLPSVQLQASQYQNRIADLARNYETTAARWDA
jgi:hypothetical protein